MRRTIVAMTIGASDLSTPAAAAPGVDQPARIDVSAVRKPLMRTYRAVLAGLDAFDKHHALAPALRTGKRFFTLSLYEPSWSDDAVVELVFAAAEPGAEAAAATGTAAETPRTAP